MVRIKQLWLSVRSSYWLLPALINLILAIIALFVIELDHVVADSTHPFKTRFLEPEKESVRAFLATIAGSMMTIAGVVFSITILVLAQTAGQYTSRVLRNFMSKKSTQLVLGIFVGIFVFCLFLITSLHPTDNAISTLAGFVMAIVAVAFLIYFIHQTSLSIQSSEIIGSVFQEIYAGIIKHFPEKNDSAKVEKAKIEAPYPIFSEWTGYIQALDIKALNQLACSYSIPIHVHKAIGDFLAHGEEFCSIGAQPEANRDFEHKLKGCFVIGRYRSGDQDLSYGVQQLSGIAVRGLSPGLCDLSTAQTAIDYLGSIFIQLGRRDLGDSVFYCNEKPILFIPIHSYEKLVNLAFPPICANAKNQPTIQDYMEKVIQQVANATSDPERRESLFRYSKQAKKI